MPQSPPLLPPPPPAAAAQRHRLRPASWIPPLPGIPRPARHPEPLGCHSSRLTPLRSRHGPYRDTAEPSAAGGRRFRSASFQSDGRGRGPGGSCGSPAPLPARSWTGIGDRTTPPPPPRSQLGPAFRGLAGFCTEVGTPPFPSTVPVHPRWISHPTSRACLCFGVIRVLLHPPNSESSAQLGRGSPVGCTQPGGVFKAPQKRGGLGAHFCAPTGTGGSQRRRRESLMGSSPWSTPTP